MIKKIISVVGAWLLFSLFFTMVVSFVLSQPLSMEMFRGVCVVVAFIGGAIITLLLAVTLLLYWGFET